jgi:hypothetical protein
MKNIVNLLILSSIFLASCEKNIDLYPQSNITTENLKELMKRGRILLNLIIRDAQLLQAGHSLGYYTQIPENRSPKRFLDHLRRA